MHKEMMMLTSAAAPAGPAPTFGSPLHRAPTAAQAAAAPTPVSSTAKATGDHYLPPSFFPQKLSLPSRSYSYVRRRTSSSEGSPFNFYHNRSTLSPIRQGTIFSADVGDKHFAQASKQRRKSQTPVRAPLSRHEHYRKKARPDAGVLGSTGNTSLTMSPAALVANASSSADCFAAGSSATPGAYSQDPIHKGSTDVGDDPTTGSAGELSHPLKSQTLDSEYDFNGSEAGGPLSHSDARRPRRRRKPGPPELLVIVRPPPSSKDRNPLNLQIQLVVSPPAAAALAQTGRMSGEASRDSGITTNSSPHPGGIARRASVTSTRSGRSEATTASSSVGSNISACGVKRVIPLYNLSFHSILPTIISDAGTDQRVAKYSRKGVEIDGFGTLEPSELIFGLNDVATLAHAAPISPPTGSIQEPTSNSGIEPDEAQNEPPTSFEAMTPEAQSPETAGLGARFARKFKSLSLSGPKALGGLNTAATYGNENLSAIPASSSFASFFSGLGSAATNSKVNAAFSESSLSAKRPASSAGIASSIFGHQRSARTPAGQPDVAQLVAGAGLGGTGTRRTHGYYWTIKRYNRKTLDGTDVRNAVTRLDSDGQNPVLAKVWQRFNTLDRTGGQERHPPPRDIPVRIEWTREGRSNSLCGARAGDATSDFASKRASISSTAVSSGNGSGINVGRLTTEPGWTTSMAAYPQPHFQQSESSPCNASRRNSASGLRSPGGSVRSSMDQQSIRDRDAASDTGVASYGDDSGAGSGYESDPEDSETPWSCHLVLGPSTRILIGTLSPAPHHPKIVAQLAVPFPLPDLSQTGLGTDGAGLTREEIKDIICVTCFHLIIRKSFGGLGRVRRRGDRI